MLKKRGIGQDRLARRPLLLLLGLSCILRAVLVLRGGQLYFPDEQRYFRALQNVSVLGQGDPGGVLDLILGNPDHAGFALLATVPAAVQHGLDSISGLSQDSTLWISALILSLMSVACIGLTAAIARRAGAGETEALIAAILMAAATSMLYFSRHLMPYDLSLALGLLALWTALDARPSFAQSAGSGFLAGLGFFTYYGYWALPVMVGLIHIFWTRSTIAERVKRAVAFGCGFALLPTLLTFASILKGATPFVLAMAQFAGTINQGDPAEGWRLPWEYLWDAEHGLFVVWVIGTLVVVWLAIRRRGVTPARGALWLGAGVGIYLALAIPSTGLGKFVVYGRLVRQLVPFFCLATAFSLNYIAEHWELKRQWVWLGAIALVAQVAFNFRQPLLQRFPADVVTMVSATDGYVGRALTIEGPGLVGYECCFTPRYFLINAQYIYPVRDHNKKRLPAGRTIFQTEHPLQFLPYQYEGPNAYERALLRTADLRMRIVDTATPESN